VRPRRIECPYHPVNTPGLNTESYRYAGACRLRGDTGDKCYDDVVVRHEGVLSDYRVTVNRATKPRIWNSSLRRREAGRVIRANVFPRPLVALMLSDNVIGHYRRALFV
jgi:hypothetical protein